MSVLVRFRVYYCPLLLTFVSGFLVQDAKQVSRLEQLTVTQRDRDNITGLNHSIKVPLAESDGLRCVFSIQSTVKVF